MTYLSDSEVCGMIRARLPQLSPRRALVLEALLPLVGLEPASAAYQAAVYPYDPPSQRRALALRQSGCGLVTEIGWRAAGGQDARLRLPAGDRAVRGGVLYPVALERTIAQQWAEWRSPDASTGELPLEGDAVIIGSSGPGLWGKGGFSGEHEFTVGCLTTALAAGGAVMHSIDGGQPGIHARTRVLVWCGPRSDELWAASLDDSGGYVFDPNDMRPTKGRRVLGWMDTDALDGASALCRRAFSRSARRRCTS